MTEEVENMFDDAITGFVEMGTRCVDVLVALIENTVGELIDQLFTPDWSVCICIIVLNIKYISVEYIYIYIYPFSGYPGFPYLLCVCFQ